MVRPDFTPPDWFRFRSRQQEEVVDVEKRKLDACDEIQKRGLEKAKADALPMMAAVVQDMESRPTFSITGGTRPWNPEVWARVRKNERKKVKYWISYFFRLFTYVS